MRGALACAPLLVACALVPPAPEAQSGRYAMGTVLELRLRRAGGADPERLLEQLFAEVARLERLYSRFDPESDLSRLNRLAGRGPQPVAPELLRLLAAARDWSALTQGSFDVTVGPLVELWSGCAARGRLPDAEALARARARVGAERIRVEPETGRVALEAGVSVDLGGVAKGEALDALAALARRNGATGGLFVFGGSSIQALGSPPGEAGWRVLLRDAGDGFAGVATLRDRALSVSASTGQSSEIEGRRYGHVIDPRTGWPLAGERVAAVVAPSGALAEALSKALLILEPDHALALLERLDDVEGMLLEPEAVPLTSPGWKAVTRFETLPREPEDERSD